MKSQFHQNANTLTAKHSCVPIGLSNVFSRRRFARSLVGGSLLMPAILQDLMASDATPLDPLAPKAAHFPAKAKRVIFIFLSGGFSHVDTFNHRPKLFADAGKKIGESFLKAPGWEFSPRGKCGMEMSSLFPHLGNVADDLCLINSMVTDAPEHTSMTFMMHTGSANVARPSIGSWISYGLGTENQNLPSFVVIAPDIPYHGAENWGAEFLPAVHQGTRIIPGDEPIANLQRRLASGKLQELELEMIAAVNKRHLEGRESDPQLAARMRSFETAAGMQMQAPEALDTDKESDATLAMYGIERGQKKGFAWQALAARRLIERGVRFVEVIDRGSGLATNWDHHGDMKRHEVNAKDVDQPLAALITDLKQRGLFDDTLVVITTEFGRTPAVVKPDHKGREHHAKCFSSFLAGAGVKRGLTFGKSDEYGINVVEDRVHVHDFHATILHLLGFDFQRLTYRHAGLDHKLTGVNECRVVSELLT